MGNWYRQTRDMTPTLSRLPQCLALAVAWCWVACASATVGDGAAVGSPDLFLAPPQSTGWKMERDRDSQLPRLSSLHLQSEDGAIDVEISMAPLARGGQAKDHLGAIPVAEWLPKNKRWLLVGKKDAQCFWQDALSPSGSPPRLYSGQARCRRPNFVLIFNLFSRRNRRDSETIWKNGFARIVMGTKTIAPCLDPEEMTFLADSEGPPFVSRTIGSDTVIVAAASMCGSGGCRCFRYERRAGCFHLVLPPYRCDEELRPVSK